MERVGFGLRELDVVGRAAFAGVVVDGGTRIGAEESIKSEPVDLASGGTIVGEGNEGVVVSNEAGGGLSPGHVPSAMQSVSLSSKMGIEVFLGSIAIALTIEAKIKAKLQAWRRKKDFIAGKKHVYTKNWKDSEWCCYLIKRTISILLQEATRTLPTSRVQNMLTSWRR